MKRVLSSGPKEEYLPWTLWRQNGDNPPFIIDQGVGLRSSYYKRTEGFDIPNFYALKRSGKIIPMTPFRQYEASETVLESSAFSEDDQGSYTRRFWYEGFPAEFLGKAACRPSESLLASKMDGIHPDYYVQAAAAKIYSSGWDALTFLAELHKTAALFKGVVGRWTEAARNGQFEKLYLESRYGWRILKYDIEDINRLLTELKGEQERFRESVGTDITSTEISSETLVFDYCDEIYTITDVYTIGVRGTVVADIKPPSVAFNPVTTAWELIRFSFIIDWVLDVGQALEAMSFLVLSTDYTAAGGVNVHLDRKCVMSLANMWRGNYIGGDRKFSYECKADLTVRTPSSVSISPLKTLKLNALKVADLGALFIQALRRK